MLNHEARKRSIGASEIAAILECNENMSPLDVWLVKTGRKPPFEGNEHTRRGNRQEAQILDWLAEDLGMGILTNCPSIAHSGGLATATPDGIVCDYMLPIVMPLTVWGDFDAFKDQACCEAKSTLKPIYYDRGTPDFRERDITDMPNFWLQCQWQMLCTGLKKCHLAIFGPMVSQYQRFEIEYNEEFALQMLADAQEWWQRHIVEGVQPEPINTDDALMLWPRDNGGTIEAVPELYKAITDYKAIGAEIKALEKRKEELKNRITPAIGAAQVVKYCGMGVASYKTQSKAAYTVKASETRVLRV